MNNSDSAVIGAHTHLHPSLGALTYEEQLNEIKKLDLDQKVQREISWKCSWYVNPLLREPTQGDRYKC